MSYRKGEGQYANHERWSVSYADFITLLFALFVVMVSASKVDKRKVGKLATANQVAFMLARKEQIPLNKAEKVILGFTHWKTGAIQAITGSFRSLGDSLSSVWKTSRTGLVNWCTRCSILHGLFLVAAATGHKTISPHSDRWQRHHYSSFPQWAATRPIRAWSKNL